MEHSGRKSRVMRREKIELDHLRIQTVLGLANCLLAFALSAAGLFFTVNYNQNAEKDRLAEEGRAAQNACVEMSTQLLDVADPEAPPKKQLQIVALAEDVSSYCARRSQASTTLVASVLESMKTSDNAAVAIEASEALTQLRIDTSTNISRPSKPGSREQDSRRTAGATAPVALIVLYSTPEQKEEAEALAARLEGTTFLSSRFENNRAEPSAKAPSPITALTCYPRPDCEVTRELRRYLIDREGQQVVFGNEDPGGPRRLLLHLRTRP